MRILKRNYEHRNLILFLVFSLVYLQAIYSLSQGQSVLTQASVKSFFFNHYLIFALTLLTIYMVVNVKKHSDKEVKNNPDFICPISKSPMEEFDDHFFCEDSFISYPKKNITSSSV